MHNGGSGYLVGLLKGKFSHKKSRKKIYKKVGGLWLGGGCRENGPVTQRIVLANVWASMFSCLPASILGPLALKVESFLLRVGPVILDTDVLGSVGALQKNNSRKLMT